MIDTIFQKLDPYLRGVKKADSYSIIESHLKSTWLIPEHPSIKHQAKKIEGGLTYYMFYSDDDQSFDKIIEWLQVEVVDMNIETEQKEELLKQKVKQLKEVFESSTLDELKNLKFSSDEDVLKLGGSSKNKTEKKKEVKVPIEQES